MDASDGCHECKMTAQPLKPTGSGCSKLVEDTHLELMGPISPKTPDAEEYVLTVIDEHSGRSAVVLEEKPDDVKEAVCEYDDLPELVSGDEAESDEEDDELDENLVLNGSYYFEKVHKRL